jgi:hypothetical protein
LDSQAWIFFPPAQTPDSAASGPLDEGESEAAIKNEGVSPFAVPPDLR